MTTAERVDWARRRDTIEAEWSPHERARQATALKRRRQRAEHNAEFSAEINAK
jgi:hypothetical protein